MSLTVPSVTTLQTALADELGEDSSDTEVMSRLERWLNDVFEDVLSRCPDWKWARDYKQLVLGTSYNTGTVTTTQGSTTVTGSGTTWNTSWVNRIFFVPGNGVNYKVASVGSTTSLTLETAYQETGAAGLSYQLVQNRYPLDNQAHESGIIKIINPYATDPLEEVDIVSFIRRYPNLQEFGDPTEYAVIGQEDPANTNGNAPMIYFNRYPSTARAFTYFFHKQFDRITGSSKFPLPPKYNRRVLMTGVKLLCGRFDNEQQSEMKDEFEGYIKLMLQDNSKTGERPRYFRESDLPFSQSDTGAKLPPGYPFIKDL